MRFNSCPLDPASTSICVPFASPPELSRERARRAGETQRPIMNAFADLSTREPLGSWLQRPYG
eukprot:4830952-Pyramimonas_sp.AAC.1